MIDEKKLAALIAANPVRELIDAKTGEGNGRYMVFARLHFPALDKPKAFEDGGAAKYSGCFIIDPRTDITKLINAARVAAVAKFGADKARSLAGASNEHGAPLLRMPFRKQEVKAKAGEDGFGNEGYFFNASEGTTWPDGQPKDPPALFSPLMKRYPQDTKEIYAGCYGLVKVSFFGYSNRGNNGVSVALGGFQKLADGERLRTSKADPADGFAPVAGAAEFANASAPAADALEAW
jgi:hypothetical protein